MREPSVSSFKNNPKVHLYMALQPLSSIDTRTQHILMLFVILRGDFRLKFSRFDRVKSQSRHSEDDDDDEFTVT